MRTKYKNRIRKSTKYIYTAIATVLLIISVTSLLKNVSNENIKTRTKEIYQYTNKYNYSYNVNLEDNRFITSAVDRSALQAYVTDLINNITLDFNYRYEANKNSEIEYKYSIIGILQVVYSKDSEEQKIWQQEETLLEGADSRITNNAFALNEKLNIDLKSKNDLINDFKQEMGMTVEALYRVKLKVVAKTNIEGKDVEMTFEPEIQINLADKTTKITGDNNIEKTEYISTEYNVANGKHIYIIILDIIAIAISVAIFKYIGRSRVANKVRNEFRQELNRILKLCNDKIVQISTKPTDKSEDIVYVKDFGEIVKVSEELFKPILYYFDQDKEEAWFSVVSGQTIYRYILRK